MFTAPAVAQPPGIAPAQPAAQTQAQPNGLPLPPGYRPRTPPPQMQPQAQLQQPAPGMRPGTAGSVMYFQKPADALTATGGGLPGPGDGVAQLGAPPSPALAAPDVQPARPLPAPAAPAYQSRPAPAIPLGNPPAPRTVPVEYAQPQPGGTSTSQKQDPPKEVPEEETRLPSREKIFGVAYNDRELERAVMDAIRTAAKKNGTELNEASLKFPPLPAISPPGVAYQPKTPTYAPHTVYLEPGYVVHRRLHFEEKNAERAGWDLGPLQTLVSAGYFYKGVLFWPYSLASGCRHGFWDTSAGKCLPGSPTPYYLYPPGLSLTGTVAEAGIITGAAFLFP